MVLNEIQMQILQKLLFKTSLRYSDLRPNKSIENNLLNYHINKLEELSLIEKDGTNYVLTSVGKKFVERLDDKTPTLVKQAKVSAWVYATRINNGNTEYLMATRLKHPFYGCQGFISGKVKFGENITEAASRELNEETGLKGTAVIVGLKHYRVFEKGTNDLLEDKLMFLCSVKDPVGEIKNNNEVECYWVPENDIPKVITKPFESIEELINQIKLVKEYNGRIKVIEEDHYTEKF